MKKIKIPRCIHCNKPLARKTISKDNQKEPYRGNMICYKVKKAVWGENIFSYSYILWDGESRWYFYGKKFCGRKCASMWAVARA